jgi:hypothetical protein
MDKTTDDKDFTAGLTQNDSNVQFPTPNPSQREGSCVFPSPMGRRNVPWEAGGGVGVQCA